MQKMFKVRVRKWGNSVGIIIPSDIVRDEGLKPGTDIELMLLHDSRRVLHELYGSLKGKGLSGQKFKDEIRRELYGIK